MKRRKAQNLRKSVQRCVLGISVIFVALTIVIVLFSYRNFYSRQMTEVAEKNLNNAAKDLNTFFSDMEDDLGNLIYSRYDDNFVAAEIIGLEEGSLSDYERFKASQRFTYVAQNVVTNDKYVEAALLICENGRVYSYFENGHISIDETYESSEWFAELQSENYGYVEAIVDDPDNDGEKLFVVARSITNIEGTSSGIVLIVCNMDLMENTISEDEGEQYCLIGTGGETFYGAEEIKNLPEDELDSILNDTSETECVNEGNRVYAFTELDVNEWGLLYCMEYASLLSVYSGTIFLLIGLVVMCAIVSLIWTARLDRRYTKPIYELSEKMKYAARNGLEIDNPYQGREDEIGTLYYEYNHMWNQINELIVGKYESEIAAANMKLKMFSSQINSHFLFNTLGDITCLAQINGNSEIEIISKSLGDMLRYNIDFETQEVELSREIDLMRTYLKIGEVRYGHEIHFNVEPAEETLLSHKVLKFFLQPIIENTLDYGFQDSDEEWSIRIKIYTEDGCLKVLVRDNGAGADSDFVDSMNEKMRADGGELVSHLGLRNINRRIRILYGDEYGIRLESEKGIYFAVEVSFPLRKV